MRSPRRLFWSRTIGVLRVPAGRGVERHDDNPVGRDIRHIGGQNSAGDGKWKRLLPSGIRGKIKYSVNLAGGRNTELNADAGGGRRGARGGYKMKDIHGPQG